VPSLIQELACTYTAKWLRDAQTVQRSAWNDRSRCFEALDDILAGYRSAHPDGRRRSQSPVSPRRLLKDVARGAHFGSPESVYQRWRAQQNDDGIRRWAGNDTRIRPREAFVAEAKLVSFWPYRAGALAVADRFEMSLTEVAASYLRSLAAWARDAPVLAACAPAGPPPCVQEDMKVLARRALRRRGASRGDIDGACARLVRLASHVVTAVLDDVSITPLGAFNMIRDEALQLLSDPPDAVTAKVNYALTELADRLLHRREGEQVITAGQARNLQADLTALGALLASAMQEALDEPAADPVEEPGRSS
jgi:hypothetical protein